LYLNNKYHLNSKEYKACPRFLKDFSVIKENYLNLQSHWQVAPQSFKMILSKFKQSSYKLEDLSEQTLENNSYVSFKFMVESHTIHTKEQLDIMEMSMSASQ
jgi:hypothetical protein